MQSIMPQKPDYSMYTHRPIGFGEQDLAQYRTRKEQLDYLVGSADSSSGLAAEQETEKEIRAREWQATLDHLPELKDATRLNSFVGRHPEGRSRVRLFPAGNPAHVGLDHRQVPVIRTPSPTGNCRPTKPRSRPRSKDARPFNAAALVPPRGSSAPRIPEQPWTA
jgi:hypothetical protein